MSVADTLVCVSFQHFRFCIGCALEQCHACTAQRCGVEQVRCGLVAKAYIGPVAARNSSIMRVKHVRVQMRCVSSRQLAVSLAVLLSVALLEWLLGWPWVARMGSPRVIQVPDWLYLDTRTYVRAGSCSTLTQGLHGMQYVAELPRCAPGRPVVGKSKWKVARGRSQEADLPWIRPAVHTNRTAETG